MKSLPIGTVTFLFADINGPIALRRASVIYRRLLIIAGLITLFGAPVIGGAATHCPGPADKSITPREAVECFDPRDLNSSFARLDAVTNQGPAVIPQVAHYLSDANPVRRFAALYVVSQVASSDKDKAVLRPVLSDPAPANRVIAAGSLASLGDVQALRTLIAGLDAGDLMLPFSDPPQPVAQFARQTLEAYTEKSFSTSAGWKRWWETVKGKIRWDGRRYVTP